MRETEIVIRLKLPAAPRKSWLLALGAVVLAGGAMAYAYDTSWIQSNQPVSATALKKDLDDAQSRLTNLETLTYSNSSYDIRWGLGYATAAAVCATHTPQGGLSVIPIPSTTIGCAAACAANTGGATTHCAATIRVANKVVSKPADIMTGLGYVAIYDCLAGPPPAANPADPATPPGDAGYCCCY